MGGRVYDRNLGRFLQVDPFISNGADSQSLNPYSYVGNNPLSGIDPTGYTVVVTAVRLLRAHTFAAHQQRLESRPSRGMKRRRILRLERLQRRRSQVHLTALIW
jgi:hypothetical protein